MSKKELTISDYVVKINVIQKEIDLNMPSSNYFASSSGTGFFVNNHYILTCYHVVKNNFQIEISLNTDSNLKFPAEVIAIFPKDDLAIIASTDESFNKRFESFKLPFREIDETIISNETIEVTAYGFPMSAKNLIITRGTISGFEESMIQTSTPLNPGNSGGPLIYNKRVIGINAKKNISTDVDNVAYAIPIKKYLLYKNNFNGKKVYFKPTFNLKYQPIERGQYKFFNISKFKEINSGIRVSKLNKDSIFYKKGLRKNDILLKWNGKEIDNFGNIKIDDFPIKVNLEDINLWTREGTKIKIEYFCENKKEFKIIEFNWNHQPPVPDSYIINGKENLKFAYNISDLTISIITNEHCSNLDKLNLNMNDKFDLINKIVNHETFFVIYLVSQIPNTDEIYLPIGEIIKKINGKSIKKIEDLQNIEKIESIEFRSNYKFYLN